jgi:hypothetical protein
MDSIEAEYQELHRGRTWTASQHAIQQSAKCGNTNLLWCLLIDSWTTRKIGNPYMVLMAMTFSAQPPPPPPWTMWCHRWYGLTISSRCKDTMWDNIMFQNNKSAILLENNGKWINKWQMNLTHQYLLFLCHWSDCQWRGVSWVLSYRQHEWRLF